MRQKLKWFRSSHQAPRRRGSKSVSNNARNFIHTPLLTDSNKSSATSRKHVRSIRGGETNSSNPQSLLRNSTRGCA